MQSEVESTGIADEFAEYVSAPGRGLRGHAVRAARHRRVAFVIVYFLQ